MKLSGVMLGSENPTKLAELYTAMLGEPSWQEDEWFGYGDGGSSLMIGPHSEVHGQNAEPPRIMVSFTAEDVQAEFNRIKELGATVIAEPYQPSKDENPEMWLATFADADGNYFQLSSPWTE